MAVSEITPEQLRDLLTKHSDLPLIDVRSPVEYRQVHVRGAENMPFDTLKVESLSQLAGFEPDGPTYVICKAGVRSLRACERLAEAGFENAISVQGGTDACVAAGLTVSVSEQGMSLERQVRLVAGGIVFVSSVLALTVHEYFAGVAAFIGAGLMFAAITNSCGMGMLLAKMPWNR